MFGAASFLVGLPAVFIGLVAADFGGAISLVAILRGAVAIISFAVIAAGWTIDHDV